jgi:hypothetical protein
MTKRFSLRDLVDDRPQDGVFRVNRAMFRDPELFALEMKHVFEGGWVFVGLATQAESPHDISPDSSAAFRSLSAGTARVNYGVS